MLHAKVLFLKSFVHFFRATKNFEKPRLFQV